MDYASFKHGGAAYPLPLSSPNTSLRDCDPTVAYMLEYFAGVLDIHLGARLASEAAAAGCADIFSATVAQKMPFNPEPFLTDSGTKFPLLGIARQKTTFRYIGYRRVAIDVMQVTYAFAPVTPAQAEAIVPFLHAAVAIIDNRTEQGFDPAFTPDGGNAGDIVWSAPFAGLCSVDITSVEYGGFAPTADSWFPAIVMTVTVEEREEAKVDEFKKLAGGDVAVTTAEADGTEQLDIADIAAAGLAPKLFSISPTTGTKAGGTVITVTCTGAVVGRRYRVLFDGVDASSVIPTSTTTIQCMAPQFDAYPTRQVDVQIIDQDGAISNDLPTAYTFTTP